MFLKTGVPTDRPGNNFPSTPCQSVIVMVKDKKKKVISPCLCIEERYESSHKPTPYLPAGWVPECSIVEGMFMINTSPFRSHSTMADYAEFLPRRFITSQFAKGGNENIS